LYDVISATTPVSDGHAMLMLFKLEPNTIPLVTIPTSPGARMNELAFASEIPVVQTSTAVFRIDPEAM
jgi:hypothetical protein